MAYNKVVIDVEARFVDNVTNPVNKADRAVDNLGRKRPKVIINVDNRDANNKIDKTEKKINDYGSKKPKPRLDAEDAASKKIDRVLDKMRKFADKIFSATVRIRDSGALSLLNKISDTAMSLAGKTFTATMKIKDLALSPLRLIKDTVFSIKGLIAGIFTGIAARQLVAMPIGLADQYSSAKIGFQTLLGDVTGQKMMDDLDAFAKATPFKTSEVIASTQKMIAMGWQAENIIDDMTTIGDAAAATGKGDEGLNRIVLALAQIKSKGKLSTEELNQLAEAGIAAKRYLAEGLGYGSGDEGIMALSAALEKGKIGSEEAINAIMAGMKEYEGMMQKTANETVMGLRSQIEDTFEINIFRRWGQGLQDGAKRGLGSVVELLDTADASLAKVGDMLFEIGEKTSGWVADKLEEAVKKVKELVDTEEFEDADLGGKIKILWDGVIADPIKEWWDGGGREKTAETAGKVGQFIGKFLSSMWTGIFKGTGALIDDGGIAKEGAGVAESFVRGFLDGFDGQAITDAFVDAVKNVWSAIPTWGKVLLGGVAAGKVAGGIQALAGGAATLMGGAAAVLGNPGNTMVRGAGLSSILANLGYTITGGAAGSGLTGSAAAVLGGGAIAGAAGGAYGLYTGARGIGEMVSGVRSGNEAQRNAGSIKAGGVAGGAIVGGAIGSMILPGVGTAIGAGIGAGAGAIAGVFGAKKYKEWDAAQKSLSQLSVEAQESSEAALTMEQRQAKAAKFMKDSFGTLAMSLSELEVMAKNLTLGDKAKQMGAFSEAASTAANNMQAFSSSAAALDKWNWRASVGFEFSETDAKSYKEAAQLFIDNAKATIESEHFKVKAAVDMLIAPEEGKENDVIKSANEYFKTVQEKLGDLETDLTEKINVSLEDGEIDADEQKIIAGLQAKISEITNKFEQTQQEAELEAIKIKFTSGQLDAASFAELQEQLQEQVESSTATYDKALTSSITNIKLELSDGAISQEEYDAQLQALTDGYTANIDQLKANASSVQFEILGDAMGDVLGDDAKGKLQSALQTSIENGISPISWTPEQAAKYLGVDSLSTQATDAIATALSAISVTLYPEFTSDAEANQAKIEEAIKPQPPYTFPTDAELETKFTSNKFLGRKLDDFGIKNQYDLSTNAKLTVNWSYVDNGKRSNPTGEGFRGGIFYPNGNSTKGYSTGGIVRGGARLIKVAEEGSPEMVIPLSSQRRERGLKLWEKAGNMLGVPGFARGGLTNGDNDSSIRAYGRDSGPVEAVGQTVQINVGGITVEVQVGSDGSITEAIRAQAEEIAETVAGIFAEAFTAQFANTPATGGAS